MQKIIKHAFILQINYNKFNYFQKYELLVMEKLSVKEAFKKLKKNRSYITI